MLTLIAMVVLVASRMVWRRLGDKAGADGGAGSRPVVDHERFAQPLLQPSPEQPGHGFHPAAGSIGDHEQDGPRGIFLGGTGAGGSAAAMANVNEPSRIVSSVCSAFAAGWGKG
jgi:hypothetical protein